MARPTVDKLVSGNLVMHDHSESDLGAILDSRYVNLTGDTMTGNLVMNGANIDLGTNYLVGEGGSSGIYVDTSGNVGIGTTLTDGKLTIGSNNSYSELVFSAGGFSNIVAKGSGLVIEQQNANLILQTRNSGSITIAPDYNTGTGSLYLGTSGNGDTTRVYGQFDVQEGNVGIGTTAPSYKLDVAGQIRVTDSQPRIFFNGNSEDWSIYTDTSNLHIRNDTDSDNRLTLSNAGNVGIGTTAPSYKLQVSGALGIDGGYGTVGASPNKLVFGSPSGSSGTPNAGSLAFGDNTGWKYHIGTNVSSTFTPRVTFMDTGNVGIGTTAPSYKLDVAGQIRVTDSQPRIFFNGNSEDWSIYTDTSNLHIRNDTDSDNRLTLSNAGNVGIGTASPAYKLDINGTSNTVGVRVASSTANDILYYGTGTVTGDIYLLSSGISATGNTQINLSNANSTSTTANANIRVATTGSGGGDPFINFSITGQQDWAIGVDNSDSDKFKIGYSSNFNTNNVFTADTAGNVGIGTTAPQHALHIVGDRFHIDGNHIEHGPLIGTQYLSGNARDDYVLRNRYLDGNLVLGVNDGGSEIQALVVEGVSGNVGIGTTTPGGKLHINGTADDQQLIIEGHSTQTANLTEWQNSSGTILSAVNPSGNLSLRGSSPDSTIILNANNSTEFNTSSLVRGMAFEVKNAGSGSVWGITASAQTQYAGSVGSLYGMLVTGRTLNASTVVNNYYGINIQQPTITAGSVGNNTGLLISDINNADTLNYAIYTNAGRLHWGDDQDIAEGKNVILGTTTGTKIGTSTSQKLGFYNATPVVQQAYTAISDPPTQTEVTAIRDALINLGLMASS